MQLHFFFLLLICPTSDLILRPATEPRKIKRKNSPSLHTKESPYLRDTEKKKKPLEYKPLSSPHDNLCAEKNIVIILQRKGYFMTKSQLVGHYYKNMIFK